MTRLRETKEEFLKKGFIRKTLKRTKHNYYVISIDEMYRSAYNGK